MTTKKRQSKSTPLKKRTPKVTAPVAPKSFLDTFEKLGKLRMAEKKLKQEIKECAEKLKDCPLKNIKVKTGSFSQIEKNTYDLSDIDAIYGALEHEVFLAACSVTKSKLQKACGIAGVANLINKGVIFEKERSFSYRFTEKK